MYFDIDNIDDAVSHKMKLINEYKEYISMICLSCSGTGLSILTKIENEITALNFDSIREYICKNIFKDLNLDPKTKSKSNAWYVSYDPHCYFESSSVIEIPEEFIRNKQFKENTKGALPTISIPPSDNVGNAPFEYQRIPISEIYDTLKFKTEVVVENRIFDLKPVEYCEIYIGHDYQIPKGKKEAIFAQLIHNLIYLNPDVDPDYILNYIIYLNFNKTVPGTEASMNDLTRFFNRIYNGIEKGIFKPKVRIKYFHCRPNTISPKEQKALSIRMTSAYKINHSITQLRDAREYLEEEKRKSALPTLSGRSIDIVGNAPFIKVTQKEIEQFFKNQSTENGCKGIAIRTIKRYWNVEPFDLEEIAREENERIQITYIQKEEKQEPDIKQQLEEIRRIMKRRTAISARKKRKIK